MDAVAPMFAPLVPPVGAAGTLKLKDNPVEAGLAALLPRAPLKEEVDAAGTGAELGGLFDRPKSNFGLDVVLLAVVVAEEEAACVFVFPNTDKGFWASPGAGLLNENEDC